MTVYPTQTWIDGAAGGTPVDAVRLTTMEAGIQGASRAAMQALAAPGPRDFGYLGWSHDPAIPVPAVTPVSGVLSLQRLPQFVDGQTASGMSLVLASSGTLTAGSNLLGLWDSNGNLLAKTADLTASLTTPGEVSAPFLTTATLDGTGVCFAGLLLVGSAMPTLLGSGPAIAGAGSGKAGSSGPRQAKTGTGLTALPASFAPSALTPATGVPWLALW